MDERVLAGPGNRAPTTTASMRMVQQVRELAAFLDQRPDPLVGRIGAAVHLRSAEFLFDRCLLLHGFLHDGDLLSGQGVLDEAVAEFLDVALDLLDVLGGLWRRGNVPGVTLLGGTGTKEVSRSANLIATLISPLGMEDSWKKVSLKRPYLGSDFHS